MTNVGKKIKQLRELSGLSQEEMAAVTGFSSRTLRRWETGVGRVREPIVELVRTQLEARRTLTPHRPTEFSFVDLFAGIGGLRTGFEMAGGKCIFTSEWDKYAQQTYLANFGDTSDIAGDILQVAAESIPPHDILLAGFPCQPFSLAGVSKKNSLGIPHGFACDTQGTLFFEVARILKHHRPRAFMLENVKNLVSHDGGRTFRTIKNVLESDLGYTVFTKVIDAKRFVPQHRERILILGFREPNKFSWDGLELPPMENGPKLQSILHPEDGSEDPEAPYTTKDGKVSDRYYLSPHLWGYLQSYAAKHRAKGNGFGFSLVGPDDTARTLSARYHKDGSEILVKTDRETPRRLTPRECARLMGFDSGDRKFKIPVSDTQAYRQFGNSVVVPLIAAVARYMTSYLTRTTDAVQIPLAFDRISA